VTVDTSRK